MAPYPQQQCVVCGRRFRSGGAHECPRSVLVARRGAENRAMNEDDPEHEALPRWADERFRLFGERLAVGFLMLEGLN